MLQRHVPRYIYNYKVIDSNFFKIGDVRIS